jgi:Zn-dependent protease
MPDTLPERADKPRRPHRGSGRQASSRGSAHLVTIAGIPIRLHWSFAFVLVLVALTAPGADAAALAWAAGWVGALFGSVVVHEFGHSLLARRRGFVVRDIVLLPIGGVSEIEGFPGSPADEFWIAVVGPLTSVAVAGVAAAIGLFTHARLWPPTLMAGPFVARFMWMNLLLAGFNMAPALPLDGGRVLRGALAARRGEPRATALAAAIGQATGYAMIVFGVFYNLWIALIGLFVIVSARGEVRQAEIRQALAGLRVLDVMVHDTTPPAGGATEELSPSDPLYPDALEALTRTRSAALPVVVDGRQVGILRMVDVEALLRARLRTHA